jgi:phenylacetate-coenzyme A ligase PaaK-like adenylate-forming protein
MQEVKIDQKELEKRVKYVVSLSKEIPWYVRKYNELEIDPDSIRSPEDWLKAYEKGLYTTGKDLSNLITPYSVFRQWFLTSATSSRREGKLPRGKPIAMTIDDMIRNRRACKIGYEKFIGKGDRILDCFPHSPGISGEASLHGLEDFEVDTFHTGVQTLSNADEFIRWYSVFKPNVIFGLTASLYQLPLKLKDKNIEPSELEIQKFMTGGQPSSLKERKIIGKDFGGALVYDWYASTESLGPMACETKPFSDEYEVVMPEILLSTVKDLEVLSEGERGNILITNLYRLGEIPHMVLINYLFADDEATCKEVAKEGYTTMIGDIENAVINLGGGKLSLREVKEIRAELEESLYKGILNRNPPLTHNYRDENTRKDIGIIRLESVKMLKDPEKGELINLIRKMIYERSYPIWEQVEKVGSSELYIEIANPGELFKSYEKYLSPGKPLEIIKG